MAAPKYNSFWRLRSSHGRRPIFETPDKLWSACLEYFDEVARTPLKAAELVKYKGKAKVKNVNKMRAMTIGGLCIFLDIDMSTWKDYCHKEDFSYVTSRVELIIKTQKFEGAAAELLNPNIIARDLGLSDKKEHEHSGKDGGPIPMVNMPPAFNSIEEWEAWKKSKDKQEREQG
jgi:hypothetical protein